MEAEPGRDAGVRLSHTVTLRLPRGRWCPSCPAQLLAVPSESPPELLGTEPCPDSR